MEDVKFPIMSMQPGNLVRIRTEWEHIYAEVNWVNHYEGWHVNVKLEDGTYKTYPEGPDRWAEFYRA